MSINKTKIIVWSSIIIGAGIFVNWILKTIKEIKNFKIDFKKINVNSFSIQKIDFNAYYDYKNNSNIDINLSSQKYEVYVNDIYINTFRNDAENTLLANSTSPLGFNCKIDFIEQDKKLRNIYYTLATNPKKVKLKVVMKFIVRLGIIKVPYQYTWNTDFAEILGWYTNFYKKK